MRRAGEGMTELSVQQTRARPLWRRLLRGIAFLPIGVLPMIVLSLIFGPAAALIGLLSLPNAFFNGFSGRSMLGAVAKDVAAPSGMVSAPSTTDSAPQPAVSPPPTSVAAQLPLVAPRKRRGLWWKVPVSAVAIVLGLATIAAITVEHEKRESAGSETTVPAKAPSGSTGVTTAPRQPPAPAPPPRPQTLEDRVGPANVTRAGDFLLVRTRIGTVLSPKWVVIEAAQRLMDIGRWASANVAERTPGTKIALQVYASVTDQNGRQSDDLILILAISPSEFAKIDWGLFTPEQMLNLVEIEQLWPASRKAVVEFCQDRSRAQFAPRFCTQAARFVR